MFIYYLTISYMNATSRIIRIYIIIVVIIIIMILKLLDINIFLMLCDYIFVFKFIR